MKKGDFVNMYNTHSKDGTPDLQTLCGKGILIKPTKSKLRHKGDGWDEFESWSIFVFWDHLGNPPEQQQLWFVHPNDLMDEFEGSKKHWEHLAKEMQKGSEFILKTIKNPGGIV